MYNFDFQDLITSYTETVHMSDVQYRAIFRVAAVFSWQS
jgi:hypothetical protein